MMVQAYNLDGFDEFFFDRNGLRRTVFRAGELGGPPILLMQELPGMTKHTLDLAHRLVADGFVVYLPLMFGTPNRPIAMVANALRLCIQREFNFLAWHKPSPITDWLRLLCKQISAENKDRKVGAIGMCLTGRFVLSLMVEDVVIAPVMSQPGHPKGNGNPKADATLGIPACELSAAKMCAKRNDIQVLGLRFENDPFCPPGRFETMEREFGENFMRYDIDASLYSEHDIQSKAHSVLTIDYSDKADHPTRLAYEKMIGFFRDRLGA
jgi:dienelactone hydrolase